MPKIGCGCDKLLWEKVRDILIRVFKDSNIKILVFRLQQIDLNVLESETMINEELDKESVITNLSDTQNTVHSDDESPVSGVEFSESPINVGQQQIIFNLTDFPELRVRISRPFETKTRQEVYLPRTDLAKHIMKYFKDFIKPNSKHYCIFNDDLYHNINIILRRYFLHGHIILKSCKNELENISDKERQLELIRNYHEGKTNHRKINETLRRIKESYYWPNLHILIQNYINKCKV